MSGLIRHPNLRDPDGFYAALIAAHESLPARPPPACSTPAWS